MNDSSDPVRDFLRHTLATLAYRAGKAVRGASGGFGTLMIREGSRTPGEILAHMCDLLDWALSIASGRERWVASSPAGWDADVVRFFAALEELDRYLASPAPLQASPERLFQGPIADALTHVGQLAMMRRLADAPVRGENFFGADIEAGRVGIDQSAPSFEF